MNLEDIKIEKLEVDELNSVFGGRAPKSTTSLPNDVSNSDAFNCSCCCGCAC